MPNYSVVLEGARPPATTTVYDYPTPRTAVLRWLRDADDGKEFGWRVKVTDQATGESLRFTARISHVTKYDVSPLDEPASLEVTP